MGIEGEMVAAKDLCNQADIYLVLNNSAYSEETDHKFVCLWVYFCVFCKARVLSKQYLFVGLFK